MANGIVLYLFVLLSILVASIPTNVAFILSPSVAKQPQKEEMPVKRPQFFIGSRYGRSDQFRPLNVAARNDRFFLGSRYGKRSDNLCPDCGPVGNKESVDFRMDSAEPRIETRTMRMDTDYHDTVDDFLSCVYTGYEDLYRCDKHHRSTGSNGKLSIEKKLNLPTEGDRI